MRLFLCVLMALVSAPALAGWQKMGENDTVTYYMDPDTIYKSANLRKVWLIQDLKARDRDGVMSVRGLLELDCKDGRNRFITSATHSEPMANGKTLWSSEAPSEWSETQPNQTVANMLRIVCNM